MALLHLENPFQLRGVRIETAFGPDDVVGEIHLLLRRPLGGEALVDLFLGPTARQQTLALAGRRAGHADDGVEMGRRSRLEEEWNHHHAQRALLGLPLFDMLQPAGADAWMENVFQLLPLGGVTEDNTRQHIPAQALVGPEHGGAKGGDDFGQSGLPRLHDFAGEIVGVHDRDEPLNEELGGGGFGT